ncbi:MAG: diguanylate cyclase [Lachnospiraceae bacterium]|nr:diguanylate cyclase [Lachnospiraceae bacterium]
MKKNVHIKEIRGARSLYGALLSVTLIPLVIYGLVVTAYSSVSLVRDVQTEAESNLRNVSYTLAETYKALYDGDYNVVIYGDNVDFYKGDHLLSDEYEMLDTIHEETGLDISMFFYDTRLLTTIRDSEGNRYINTGANPVIVSDVIGSQTGRFYNNIVVGNEKYYAYYLPLMSNDEQTCLGMVGVSETSAAVTKMATVAVVKNIVIIVLAMVVTGFFIVRFTSGIVLTIKKIMDFTNDIAEGDLSTELDPAVANRSDELGEMGRLVTKLRGSLRRLIERDALTGIFNRRYAVNKLQEFKKTGIRYSVSIGDIDFFKKFNDTYGHECGDVVLKEVSRILRESLQPYGFAARWGGEEFLLVYDNIDGKKAAELTARALQNIRDMDVKYEELVHKVTMSFGVTESEKNRTMDEDINEADVLLYEAKESGRNQVVYKAPRPVKPVTPQAPVAKTDQGTPTAPTAAGAPTTQTTAASPPGNKQ